MIRTSEFMDNFYILDDGRVRQFLITGGEEALLIDTGFEDSHVADEVKKITDLPVRVVLTHGDRDHTGGLGDFGACLVHPGDAGMLAPEIRWTPLQERDVLECGGYRLAVVSIPGHTPGSIALIDREKGLLLPGDSVQKEGPIFMFGPHRNLDQYIESLEKLTRLEPAVRWILPCHSSCPIEAEYIRRDLEDAKALRDGAITGEPQETMPCKLYRGKWTSFYAD